MDDDFEMQKELKQTTEVNIDGPVDRRYQKSTREVQKPMVVKGAVLIFNANISSYLKISGLKQHRFIILQTLYEKSDLDPTI